MEVEKSGDIWWTDKKNDNNNAEGGQERLRCGGPAWPQLSPQCCGLGLGLAEQTL